MSIVVNSKECIGCGLCVRTCPMVFQLNSEEIAIVNNQHISEELSELIEEVIDLCPVLAIEKLES